MDKSTLIPRPETEELVEWILLETTKLQSNQVSKSLQILDIGTGSGCIPISLAKNLPAATISAVDISVDALKIATKNATLNKVKVKFIEGNILDIYAFNQILKQDLYNQVKFDIIVSNPPYVRELEKTEIQNNVLLNEPHLALFVSNL